ncbi:hypothetical protein SCACP_05460 [Sporomusa carbonis]
MKGRIVFLLEELSMKELLEGLLPRLFPGLVFQCVPHEGKTDLDRKYCYQAASMARARGSVYHCTG